MSRKLRIDDVTRVRFTPGQSLLLFLTDRCPVGCGHCSVDSKRDSPTINDYALFGELVDAICSSPAQLVGISGGEPFVERRGLTLAMDALAAADKDIAVYTSGIWARAADPPKWIKQVLGQASCVFLSTDAYHVEAVDDEMIVNAARAITDCGSPIMLQVLNTPDQVAEATRLLELAFGASWPEHADLSYIEPLPYGRGEDLFAAPPAQPPLEFRGCHLLAAPVVRYDGRTAACCNEPVIMGRGPQRLARQVHSADELHRTLDALRSDGLLNAIAATGGAVTMHPELRDLADSTYRGICDLCWQVQEATDQVPLGDDKDPFFAALSLQARHAEQ